MGSVEKFLCNCVESSGLERMRYFPRQLLTADDMRVEQEYFREKQRRHNRFLHGWGVVCGLEVRAAPDDGPLAVRICPGYALGPYGDEIYVPTPVPFDLAQCVRRPADPCDPNQPVATPLTDVTVLLMIRYTECPTRPVRTLPAGCGCDETACEYSRIRDGFEIQCKRKPGNESAEPVARTLCEIDKDKLPACPPCPDEPWVVLAAITLIADQKAGVLRLGSSAIDHSERRIVYSTGLIQQQLIRCCCGSD